MTTFNGQASIYNYFRVGGMFSLPGYSENELAAQNAVLFNAGYMHAFKPLLSMPTYIGINMLYGDLFENKDDIELSDMKLAGAVYLGMKSVVGPLYVGYGLAEGGSQRVYFNIGGLY
jgi:NTE family protein